MKSFKQEIRLYQEITSKKMHYLEFFRKKVNNNRREICQEMSTSTQLGTSTSQKNIHSFMDKCLQDASSSSSFIQASSKSQITKKLNLFPQINQSQYNPRLKELLNNYSLRPKEERLLKGQNQLILERIRMKSDLKKKKVPMISINSNKEQDEEKDKNALSQKKKSQNNSSGVDKETCESMDSDRMDFDFDISKDEKMSVRSNDDEMCISPSKKYNKIPIVLSRTALFKFQSLQRKFLSSNVFITNKGNDVNCSVNNSNNSTQNIIKAYDDINKGDNAHGNLTLMKDNNDNDHHQQQQQQQLKQLIKHNRTMNNLSTCLSNIPFLMKKQFNHNSSQTSSEINKLNTFKLSNQSQSESQSQSQLQSHSLFKLHKANFLFNSNSNNSPAHSLSCKRLFRKKKKANNVLLSSNSLSTNPYGLGIIFHSSTKFSYVIQLNNLSKWQQHEAIWHNTPLDNTIITKDNELNLLPPNIKDTLISSFYYNKSKKSKSEEENCFIYSLDHHHVRDFTHESTKWKKAYGRVVERWNQDAIDSFLVSNADLLSEEAKRSIRKEASIIVEYAEGLYKNIIDILVEIFRYKLKKKLGD